MPAAIPVIAGLATAAAGASAITVAAGFTLANIAAGAMIVGGAMTAIGGITGNKKLMTAGAIISIAGGIGSWAAGAFNAGTATSAEVAANQAAVASQSGAVAGETVVTNSGAFSSATPAVFDSISAGSTSAAAAVNAAGTAAPMSTAGDMAGGATITAPPSVPSTSLTPLTGGAGAGGGGGITPPSFLDKLEGGLDKLNKYDKLIDIAGGMSKASSEEDKQASIIEAYNARADKDRDQTLAMWQAQQANVNAKFNIPVTSVPNQGGIINMARRTPITPVRA